MRLLYVCGFLAVIGVVNMAEAGSPAIGTVTAKGAFRLNQATVANNASLLEGATIETDGVGTALQFSSGARFSLAADSRGQVFGDRVILERGAGQLEKMAGLRIEARGLIIQPETGNATARIVVARDAGVQLTALTGSFRVLNSRGAVVAKLRPGLTLAFEQQSGRRAQVTGVIRNRGGHYLITDETTNVTVEVAGAGLEKEVGRRVEVSGAADPSATPVNDASQFVRVLAIKRLPSSGAAAAGAGGTKGRAGKGFGSSAGTVAVIGGIAAAAIVGGLAASGTIAQEDGISR